SSVSRGSETDCARSARPLTSTPRGAKISRISRSLWGFVEANTSCMSGRMPRELGGANRRRRIGARSGPMPASAQRRPEILAPAGTEEAFAAALASGADAVFFGLSEGFNARARSTAFDLDGLPELVRRAHRANAKTYLTVNTLVFE